MMRSICVLFVIAILAAEAAAQPAPAEGSGSAAAGSAAAAPVAVDPVLTPPEPAPPLPGADSPQIQAARKACTDAMNADPSFGDRILEQAASSVSVEKLRALVKGYDIKVAHVEASDAIAKNERHVIMAYIAMWLLSVGFLIFLWRRQAGLRGQIDQLKRDLDAAVKDGK